MGSPRSVPALFIQERRAESFGHGEGTETQEQGSLKRQCRPLGQPASFAFGNILADACNEAVVAFVEGARHTHHQQCRGFRFDGEVRQDVAHQRLCDQRAAKRMAVAAMMNGFHQRPPHQSSGTHRAIQTGMLHHLDDGGHAAPFLATRRALAP